MGGDKIVKAREAAIAALRRLGPDDLFALVAYDHEVETVVSPTPASQAEWIEGRIRALEPRGNTALFGGVSQGAAEIRRNLENKAFIHRILLLSDGQANVGPSSPIDLERLGAAFLKESISVSTMGVGLDYNEALMTGIAAKSDGNTYFVENASDLQRFFDSELGDVLSVAAKQVVVEVTFPEGVRIIRTVGREGRIEGRNVTFALNQLYGGQEKYLLLEVEVPSQAPDRRQEVAAARVVYEDAATLAKAESSATAVVVFTASPEESYRSVDNEVQAVYARNRAAEAREEAVGLNKAGRYKDAGDAIRAVNADILSLPGASDNAQVQEQIRGNVVVGREAEDRPMASSRAKLIWTKSRQDRAQQADALPDSLVAP
jgi:Ca-activated chloride channel family protein